MCLIIASPTGKRISNKILEEAANTNGHGAGIAWLATKEVTVDGKTVKESTIEFRKGLEVAEVIEILDRDIDGKPWVVHFRIATHGPVGDELTHPFTIDAEASTETSGNADAVFFQNGTFSSWKEYLLQAAGSSGTPVPEPPWSDSRAIAFCLHVYGKHMLSVLDNQSRFLVFDAKDKVENRMLLWGDWHDFEEFKFSNKGTSAFYAPRAWEQNNRTNAGGRSENPQKAASQVAGSADAAASSKTNEDPTKSSTNANTTSQQNSDRAEALLHENSVRETRAARTFKPKAGHSVWKSFTAEGLFVRAANEDQPVTTLT